MIIVLVILLYNL